MTEKQLARMEVEAGVATITLDSPPLNILTAAMMERISGLLEQVEADTSLVALVVRANGKAFSAGADVGEHQPDQAGSMIGAFSRMFEQIGRLEIPVVMAVDGAALGAGFELALMADVLIAGERASFGQPEIRLGFFAPLGVAWLPRLVGPQRAMEITCSGRSYTAQQMKEWGLVSHAVPSEQVDETVAAVVKDFRRASPLVMRMNVRLVRGLAGQPFEKARREAERVFLEELMVTEDVREGIASFFEKRRPEWKNR